MGYHRFINILYSMCISGEKAEMSMIVKLLEADTESSDALYLRECAYRAALIITKEKAYVWGMLNICQMPLFMSTKNNSVRKNRHRAADNKLVDVIGFYKEKGMSSIILNPHETAGRYLLPEKIVGIKERTGCSFKIAAIAGGRQNCNNTENNMSPVYRGADKENKIEFVTVVEFECREYSNNEVAEIISDVLDRQQNTSCIVLEFTKCREQGFFSDEKIAQITAVLRLASGSLIKNICVSPVVKKACISGANAALVSVGENIYDLPDERENNIKTVFYKAGYNI